MTRDKNPARVAAGLREGLSPKDKIEVEPGAEKRLSGLLKKALNTAPSRKQEKPTKSEKKKG